jgi:hypothetical protein
LYEVDYNLLRIFYDLIIDYENWITKRMGIEYRQHTLNSWIKKKVVDAESLILTWELCNNFLKNKLIKSQPLKTHYKAN